MATLTDIYSPGLGSVTEVTAPTAEPVSLADVKTFLHVDDNDENELIQRLVVAARDWCERFTGRQFMTATYDWRLDAFPDSSADCLWVPRPPLASVTSITYTATDGTSTTWGASNYQTDIYSEPARILPAYGVTWPSTRDVLNAVTIRFVCGAAETAVKETVKQAIKMLVAHWFESREPVLIGSISKDLEFALTSLLWMDRVLKAA